MCAHRVPFLHRLLLFDHSVKEFLQVFVIGLEASNQNAMMVGENEKRASHPAGRDADSEAASAIVVEDFDPFKPQLFQEAVGFALNLQTVTILTAAAQSFDVALAQDAALVQDDHRIADSFNVAQE